MFAPRPLGTRRGPRAGRAERQGPVAIALLTSALVGRSLVVAHAQPPALPPAGAPADAVASGGYWLEARGPGDRELSGAVQLALADDAALDPSSQPPDGRPSAGRVRDIAAAMAWLHRWCFHGPLPPRGGDPTAIRELPAPAIGRTFREPDTGPEHAVHFVVRAATPDDRLRAAKWPLDQALILAPDDPWRPAALVPEQAPLFAAPAARVPPRAQAHARAWRRGGLYVLGELDRCEGRGATRRCLRWAQVVARDGDTFSPGYLPLAQVAEIDAWLRLAGAELPRVQVRPIALRGERGVVQVIARTVDNTLRQTTVEVGLVAVGDGDAGATVRFPRIEARIERGADASAGASTGAASPSGAAVLPAPGVLVLTVEPATPDQPPRSVRLTLDDSLDRRPASAAPDDERPEGDRDEQPDGDRDEG